MSEWLGIGALFVAVFLGCFALLQWAIWRRQREIRRIEAAIAEGQGSTPDLILGNATPILADQMPLDSEKRLELNRDLLQAGYYRSTALVDYAAIRAVLVILPLFLAGALALLVPVQYIGVTAVVGMGLAALGYSLPRVYLHYRAARRRSEIERGLPVAVDLLALGLMSGQSIHAALRRVTQEVKQPFPVLAEELEIVRGQAEMNTLPHALAQFADRVNISEVRNLVIILTQSQRQGTDVASALMEFVNNFRQGMRQQADRRANQASFWLVFPSLFFLWLPAFVVLLAPIVFEMTTKREKTREVVEQNQKQLQQFNKQRTRPTMAEETPGSPEP